MTFNTVNAYSDSPIYISGQEHVGQIIVNPREVFKIVSFNGPTCIILHKEHFYNVSIETIKILLEE